MYQHTTTTKKQKNEKQFIEISMTLDRIKNIRHEKNL